MKIFISWSGDKSREVAEFLSDWLKYVIQTSEPWISTDDIYKGDAWFSEIAKNLNESETGIICVTKENKNKPWLLFEAGALANKFGKRVCPLLIDLDKTENPLNQLNHTLPNKKDIRKLIGSLNALPEKPIEKIILDKIFETYWPLFEEKLEEIKKKYKDDKVEDAPVKKSMDEKYDEILRGLRSLNRRIINNEESQKLTLEFARREDPQLPDKSIIEHLRDVEEALK